jgi:hypothetical protein
MDFDFSTETITPDNTTLLTIGGVGALELPVGTTLQRPVTGLVNGALRYNTDLTSIEGYIASSWVALSTGSAAITLTGDITGSGTGTVATTLATVNSNVGTFTAVTVNAKGLTTAATNLAITGDITGTASGSGLASTLATVNSNVGTFASVTVNGKGLVTAAGALTGDITSSGAATTLATVNGSPQSDTFRKITVTGKGLVTATSAVGSGDITTALGYTPVNKAGDSMTSAANLTFSGGGEVLGLPTTPSGSTAAASKAYVDAIAAGLSWKTAVRAATTVNGTLASAYENGDAIDGVTLATGDRILIKNQTTQTENGIYTVNASGAPTRATDADTGAELVNATVFVDQGTTLADTGWTQTTNAPITVGSSNIVFVQFTGAGSYVAGAGLTLTGNSFAITAPVSPALGGTGTITAPTSGQFLIGTSGNVYTPATIGTTTGISLTSGSGTLTINNTGVTALAGTSNQITASASTGSVTLSTPATFIAPGSIASTTSITAGNALTVTTGGATITAGGLTVTAGGIVVTAGLEYLSTTASVSAAGSTQGTATALTANNVVVTTVSASQGVVLPVPSTTGTRISIVNKGANALAIYPNSGGSIDAASANTAISLPVNGTWTGFNSSTTQWYSSNPIITAGTAISVTTGNGIVTVANTGVTSLSGTANQITASASTGAITLSLPSAVTLPGSLVVTTSATVSGLTANSFLYSGTSGLLTTTSAPTNGQLLVGSTGGAPVAATLTQGTGMTITNGAGSITVANAGVLSFTQSVPSFLSQAGASTATGAVSSTITLATQTANTVFSGPATAGPTAPTFRSLVYADLPLRLYVENPSSPTAPLAAGTNAIGFGSGTSASATSSEAHGLQSIARVYGQISSASGQFGTLGDAQHGQYNMRIQTSNATPTEAFLDGSSARLVLPNNSAFMFEADVVCRRTDSTGTVGAWKLTGLIFRDASAATTAIQSSVSKTTIAKTPSTLDINATADTTNGSLTMTVTGVASQTIRWSIYVRTQEVTN